LKTDFRPKLVQNCSCIGGNKESYSRRSGKQGRDGSESQGTVLASTRLFYNHLRNKQPQQMILGDLHLWLLISYDVTRSLEGYEALAVICADDRPTQKGTNHENKDSLDTGYSPL
jgi:hypothetical protein